MFSHYWSVCAYIFIYIYLLCARTLIMAKRRAEDPLLHDSPSKRCCLQLGSSAASPGGLSPPSLLALLGSRCRKRPHYFQDTDKQHEEGGGEDLYRKNTNCATITHAANNTQVQQTSSSSITSKKRPREDCTAPESAVHKAEDKVSC